MEIEVVVAIAIVEMVIVMAMVYLTQVINVLTTQTQDVIEKLHSIVVVYDGYRLEMCNS